MLLPTEQEIMQMTSQELTLLLYQGLLEKLQEAAQAIDTKNYDLANQRLQQCHDIIRRLGAGLNYETEKTAGIPLADRLEALYQYMAQQVLVANIEKKRAPIKETMTLLAMITDAWEQAMAKRQDDRPQIHVRKLSAYDAPDDR
ncbi:flagellar export chaperone FliS [Heliophilum fasciatum]|uniref:Flagellar secretion chaperone FliS n=1 Tax=Heliophilum fasciatum TaxID=35700 RepID=A0A4V2SVT9_9FIRM|nr:flagellar export chaperone FliS [Heliophilum fasciatum]MCW2279462.1 flagellar protein FliS [Heliophilum fasciatum]TCP59786.1 flagellar protein FliS [Heliophilum fasciatum]